MFISTGSFDFELSQMLPDTSASLLATLAQQNLLLDTDAFSQALYTRLWALYDGGYAGFADCGKDLSHRITQQLEHFLSFSQFADLLKAKYNIHTHLPCTAPHPAQHPAGRLCCALAAGWHSISACAWFPQGFLCASFCHQKRSIRSFDYQSCRCFFYPSWNCIQTFFTRCSLC